MPGDLTADEVKDYLDGKALDLKEQGGSITMRKAGITALAVGNGHSINNAPWEHEITFLYSTGRCILRGHRPCEATCRAVQGKQAFFGFTVERVAKQ